MMRKDRSWTRYSAIRGYLWGNVLVLLLLTACSSSASPPIVLVTEVPLHSLAWCSEPVLTFVDEKTDPPTVTHNWTVARTTLDFNPVLPPSLPAGTCLVSAGTVADDPAFGSRFSITWSLADQVSLSIAETRQQQPIPQPKCSGTTDGNAAVATCQQTLDGINVTISGQGQTVTQLQDRLHAMRPNVDWLP